MSAVFSMRTGYLSRLAAAHLMARQKNLVSFQHMVASAGAFRLVIRSPKSKDDSPLGHSCHR